MNKTSVFPYRQATTELIACNFCGETAFKILAHHDRNNLCVQTVMCRRCGLIFINPRMTKSWYQRYYEEEYREQMARFKGLDRIKQYTVDVQFKKAYQRGLRLAQLFKDFLRSGLTVETGSSDGGVLAAFRDKLGVPVLGIEPSPEDTHYAESQGVSTFGGMFEDLKETIPPAANILALRSLNHLLDFSGFLAWSHQQLAPGGRLVLEVMNFLEVARHYGYRCRAIQIDHVYMFTPRSLHRFVEGSGFRILTEGFDRKGHHMYLVAEKDASRNPLDRSLITSQWFQEAQAEITALPNSRLKYFFRFGLKRYLTIWYYRFRRWCKKLLLG